MNNKFNKKIKELRLERKLLQKELATKLGCTQACIGKWETGNRKPSIDDLIKIATFFNVTVDYLLGLED